MSTGQRAPGCARFSPSLLAALAAVLWVGFTSAPASAANPGADIEQCRNGTFAAPEQCTGSAWQTGNAGASNSHYREGDSMPFRAKLINLSTSGSHTLVIGYDTIDSGAHAYDYLTSYNRTETTRGRVLRHLAVLGRRLLVPDSGRSRRSPSRTRARRRLLARSRSGTARSRHRLRRGDAAGKRSVIVTFTASNSTVLLAWGGHIASQIDWGAGNSAGSISGSPYHMRLLNLDNGGLGNMDRSLAAAAVAPVPAIIHDAGELLLDHARPVGHRPRHARRSERHRQRDGRLLRLRPEHRLESGLLDRRLRGRLGS